MNFSDYRGMEEHDQYEPIGLDDSLEDDRDLDQIMEDRRAAEMELEARDGRLSIRSKLPQLLHDQGNAIFCLKLFDGEGRHRPHNIYFPSTPSYIYMLKIF